MCEKEFNVHRGHIYMIDFPYIKGSIQCGKRPAVCLSNSKNNLYAPTITVACITSSLNKHELPVHVYIDGLKEKSIVLCEQIHTIDKSMIIERIGEVSVSEMMRIEKAVIIQLQLSIRKENINEV